eukprot:438228_1
MSDVSSEEHFHRFTDAGLSYSEKRIYHYTTESNAKKIIKSGMIKPSRNELHDCMYGVGIYFTAVCPCNPKSDILHNNYVTETYANEDKANAVIGVLVSELRGVREVDSRRNIWLYSTSKQLDLGDVHGTVFCLSCDGDGKCKQCEGDGTRQMKCVRCSGSGAFPYRICYRCNGGKRIYKGGCNACNHCNGTGNYCRTQCYGCKGHGYIDKKCDECNGSGESDCRECDGCGHHHFCNC